MFNCFMLYVRLRTWEYHPGGPNPCTCRSRGMKDKFPFMILFSNQQLLLHACKHSLYENWNSCNFQECGTLRCAPKFLIRFGNIALRLSRLYIFITVNKSHEGPKPTICRSISKSRLASPACLCLSVSRTFVPAGVNLWVVVINTCSHYF